MAKYNKKSALQIIVSAVKAYDKKLKNKHFLIIYQENGRTKTSCVGFRDMNFLHMTGVKTTLSAQQFYSACLDGKLSENDLMVLCHLTRAAKLMDDVHLKLGKI